MIQFTKMHGIGNDFVLVNGFEQPLPHEQLPELSKAMCDRRMGIGSDGLIVAEPGETAPFQMRMFNPDGSESEMCGNGIRCFAKFVRDEGLTTAKTIPVETGAGLLQLDLTEDDLVTVDMGLARLKRGEIGMSGCPEETFQGQAIEVEGQVFHGTAVSMGNPHLVLIVPDVSVIPLAYLGPKLETHELFPLRVNVHFVEVLDRRSIKQRTWERGAGATLACGTGACAAGVATFLAEMTDRSVTVHLPGGALQIEYVNEGRVLMTGPAETVFVGSWND